MSAGRSEVALASILTMTDAINLTVRGSGLPPKDLACRLGIGYEHFMRMLNKDDSRNFPPDLLRALCVECKSTLPLDYLAWSLGYCLHEKSMTAILVAIVDAFAAEGKEVKFHISASGRIERLK
jgi:hypothetical protein